MSEGAVAERYAQAIFELAVEASELGSVTEQLGKVAEVWTESPELRVALENPVVVDAQRAAVLADVASRLNVRGTALNALQVIAARRRLGALPAIARQLTRLSDEQQGVLRASITSALPLPDSYYQSLVSKLEAATKKKVMLEKHQDASLIGGVVARIGDSIIDGSLKGRLGELEKKMLSGGAA